MDKLTVELRSKDEKKHSIKFHASEPNQAFDNLYVRKDVIPPGCVGVRVTVEFLT